METQQEQEKSILSTEHITEKLRSRIRETGKNYLALEKTLPLLVSHLSAVISNGTNSDIKNQVWFDMKHSTLEDIVTEYDMLKDIILDDLHPLTSEEKNKVIETILYYMGLSAWEFFKQTNVQHQEIEKHLQEEINIEKKDKLWFESVLDSLPVGIIIVERTTANLLFVNKFANALAGGFYPMDILPDDQDQYFATDADGKRISRNNLPRFRAARGEKLCGDELTAYLPEAQITLVFYSNVIPESQDHPERIIIAFQEIQARKKWEEERSSEVKVLKEERSIRESFVSSLTHDLRTPLSVARMHTELIARKVDGSLLDKCHNVIKHIDEVDRMIQDLLDANKLKAGEKIPIHPCEMCMNDIVNESVADFSALHGDRFIVKGLENVCGFWCGKAMRRMLDNLLGNAVKYGDPVKPVEITIDQDSNQTSLEVHNYGPEIPEQDRDNLFEPFKRAKKSDKQAGWGIGLSLVKGLIEAHGGKVHLKSKDQGTSFQLTFPNRVPLNLH